MKNAFCTIYSGFGDFMQSILFFLKLLVVTCTFMSYYKPLLDLLRCSSGSWERYTFKGVSWRQGKGGELAWPGWRGKWIAWWRALSCGTRRRRKLCMMLEYSSDIYWTWKSKKARKRKKFIIWECPATTGGGYFLREELTDFLWRSTLCNTATFKLYLLSYWVL